MPKPIDVTPVKPNVWAVLVEDEPEGGTIVRRFERWTCTCAESEVDCRHVLAARSLIARTAAVAATSSTDEATLVTPQLVKIKTKTKPAKAEGEAAQAEPSGPVLIVERRREPRPVVVRDSAVASKPTAHVAVAA